MITAQDVREEMKKAKEVIDDANATVQTKINSLLKLITVVLKMLLNVRTNQSMIMGKLGVEKIKPKQPEEKENTPDIK